MRLLVEELEPRLVLARPWASPYPAQDVLFNASKVHFTGTDAGSAYDQFSSVSTTRNADNADAAKSALGDILWYTNDKTTAARISLQTTYSVTNGSTVTFSYNQQQTLQNAANSLWANVSDHTTQVLLSSTHWDFSPPTANSISVNAGPYPDAWDVITGDNTQDKLWLSITWYNGTANAGTLTLDYFNPNTQAYDNKGTWNTGYDKNWVGTDYWNGNIARTYRLPGGTQYRIRWTLSSGGTPSTFQDNVSQAGPGGGGGQHPMARQNLGVPPIQTQVPGSGLNGFSSELPAITNVFLASTTKAAVGTPSTATNQVADGSQSNSIAHIPPVNSSQPAPIVAGGVAGGFGGASVSHLRVGNPLVPQADSLDFVPAGALGL